MTVSQQSPLRVARVHSGITQVEAATRIGIAERTLIRWEAVERPDRLPFESLSKMANLYGLSVDQLLGRAQLPEAADAV